MSQYNLDEAKAVAEVLIGAVFVDGAIHPNEMVMLQSLMNGVLGTDSVPADIQAHLDSLTPETFNVEASCGRLHLKTGNDKRVLLYLVNKVIESDHMVDVEEDEYLEKVAELIGASADDQDLKKIDGIRISSIFS